MKKKRCLILDFDGVIADSVNECLLSSYNAYLSYIEEDKEFFSIDDIPKNYVDKFKKLRPKIRYGQDYLYIHHILKKELKITTQKQFDTFIDDHKDLNDIFYSLYYQARNRFISNHRPKWLQANPLYPGIKDFLDSLAPQDTYICTTKESSFAIEILHGNHIYLLEDNIFQAKGDLTKDQIITKILQENDYDVTNSIFIDDHIHMVQSVAQTGIRSILACWGYNSPKEHKIIKEAGLESLELDKLESLLKFT